MSIPAHITFGELLKQLRRRSGMTQAELAAAVSYSVPYISNLELNQRLPDVDVVAKRFVPALALQEEPHLGARLVELAATARGENVRDLHSLDSETRRLLLHDKAARSATLPQPPTELIGRDKEIIAICNRLWNHGGRLITLLGPPGIGKTRLALAVAEKLQATYRDGVHFVSLTATNNAEFLAPTLMAELGISTTNERAPNAKVLDYLRHKQMLLVLDNFEQIIAAGPFVAQLLAACPELSILVTSRERLHLRAEQRYRVQPLTVEAALALFVQRAQAVEASFELTTENHESLTTICLELDCLPLAIELSAARIDLFTPQALLARLHERRLDLLSDGPHDLPAHQRTLRNAIHRSYALLDSHEQQLFRMLAVFAGGFAAQALAQLGGDEATLHALVNKSLVQVETRACARRRFLLLETLRDYAWEHLDKQGETAAAQQRHAEFYLRLAEEAASHLRGAAQAFWLEQLELEHANMRAALQSSLVAKHMDTAVRLGIALWRFWYVRGHYAEGGRWLEQLLPAATDLAQRAKLLYSRGMLARRQGDIVPAGENLADALALFRELADTRGIASALRGLGFIRYLQHDLEAARPLLEEALAHFRDLHDLEGTAVTLDSLAYFTLDLDEYQRLFEESLALRRQSGNRRGITMSLAGLASAAIRRGDCATARRHIEEHLRIDEELGYQNGTAIATSLLGLVLMREGNPTEAQTYFEKCIVQCRTSGDLLLLPTVIQRLCFAMLQCNKLEGVTALLVEAMALFQEQGKVLGTAEVLVDFAILALMQGQAGRALVLASAAVTNCTALTEMLFPFQRVEFERTQTMARHMLGPAAARDVWAAGQSMTLDQAASYAPESDSMQP